MTRMSAGMTLIGYAIALVLPLLGGWIAARTREVEMKLLPALVFPVVMIPALGRTRRYVCATLAAAEAKS